MLARDKGPSDSSSLPCPIFFFETPGSVQVEVLRSLFLGKLDLHIDRPVCPRCGPSRALRLLESTGRRAREPSGEVWKMSGLPGRGELL